MHNIKYKTIVLFIIFVILLQNKNVIQGDYIDKPIAQHKKNDNTIKNIHPILSKKLTILINKHKKLVSFVSAKLKQNGISNKIIKNYLNENYIKFKPEIIAANLGFIKEIKNYNKKNTIKQNTIISQKNFTQKYKQYLNNTSKQYNIPTKTIVSILWIESKFGVDTGIFNVLNVFFNLSLLQHPEVQKEIILWIKNKYPNINIYKLKKYAQKKGNWGIKEISVLLSPNNNFNSNIKNLYGSYAGAFGIAQFIPSSYVTYAKDGNKDKKIDMFNIYDAITSVANYLAKHDYNKSQTKAILSYNNSISYLNKVIANSNLNKNKLPNSITNNKLKENVLKIMKLNNKLF